MTMYGPDSVNELLNVTTDVTTTPQRLPGMTPVNMGSAGYQQIIPSGINQGKPWNPGHARIAVETGAIRVTTDGNAPDDNIGTLYQAGSVVEWTDVAADFQGFLRNARVVSVNGNPVSRINISYRN